MDVSIRLEYCTMVLEDVTDGENWIHDISVVFLTIAYELSKSNSQLNKNLHYWCGYFHDIRYLIPANTHTQTGRSFTVGAQSLRGSGCFPHYRRLAPPHSHLQPCPKHHCVTGSIQVINVSLDMHLGSISILTGFRFLESLFCSFKLLPLPFSILQMVLLP